MLLDVPVETGLQRIRERGSHDRLESEAHAFHERVRAGYHEMAAREPQRWLRLDGEGATDEVAARVRAALEAKGLSVPARRA